MRTDVGELEDRRVPCRMRGCRRTWTWRVGEQIRAHKAGQTEAPSRMCDACHAIYQSLEDREEPCSTKGCEGKWIWKRGAQLEASLKGTFEKPPKRVCPACEEKLRTTADVEKPCRIRGCKSTWTLTAVMQLKGVKEGMCPGCRGRFDKAVDLTQPCRVSGCTGTWVWNRWSQVEQAAKQGVEPGQEAKPPERLCDGCNERTKTFADQTLPCRVRGCERTWTWTKQMQVRAWAEAGGGANAEPLVAPDRMCDECNRTFGGLDDREVPCKIKGCRRTWKYSRQAQLERVTSGDAERAPARMCGECQDLLSKLEPIEQPCMNEGCGRPWLATPEQQLAAIREAQERGREPQLPQRQCGWCEEFLRTHEPIDLPCAVCGTAVHWPSHAQLRVELGTWRKPTHCSSCLAASVGT
ncbi:MAG: hypothetical protein IT379_15280 [Deltaproteobacteria bacterium]|nr:hypothetical protein [Deltaproteobacteria bacterium]